MPVVKKKNKVISLTTKCLLFLLPIIRVVPARGLLILREKDELCRRIIIIISSDDDDERDVRMLLLIRVLM